MSQELKGIMKKLIIVLAILLVIGGLAYWLFGGADRYPIVNANPSGTTIIAFGDSLTEGNGAGRDPTRRHEQLHGARGALGVV